MMSIKKIDHKDWIAFWLLVFVSILLIWQSILPWFAERRFRDGYNFTAMKRYRYAIDELEKAVNLAPLETHYMGHLGKAYESYAEQQPTPKKQLEYLKKTEDLYHRMVKLDSNNPWYQNRLALLYLKYAKMTPEKSNYFNDLVEKHTRTAANLDAKNPLFQLNLASYLHRNNNLDEAMIYYKKVIDYDPRMGVAYFNLADIYRKNGDHKKPLELYLKLKKHAPEFKDVNIAIATTLVKLKRDKDAIPYLKDALSLNPNHVNALSSLGLLYYQNKMWAEAIETYRELMTKFENQQQNHQYYIQALVNNAQIPKALSELTVFLKQNPTDAIAKLQLSKLQQFIRQRQTKK